MEEDHDFTPSEEGLDQEENVLIKVEEAEVQEKLLRLEYISKEIELNALYKDLRDLNQEVWLEKEKCYHTPVICDPFLHDYLNELAEDCGQLESVNEKHQLMEDEKDYEKEILFKKLEEINQSQKPPIEFFKTLNDVHIGFKCLVEDLNNQIFKCYQDRLQLEDDQQDFSKKIKVLRGEIKDITEKNEKLIKQIDLFKSHN